MSRFDDFRVVRFWRGLNRLSQLALAVALVLGLNYLASQPSFYMRRDLTATQSRSLSGETCAQLKHLLRTDAGKGAKTPPIEVLVTLPRTIEGEGDEVKQQRRIMETIHAQLAGMLDAFSYEAGKIGGAALTIEAVDSNRNAKLYTELRDWLQSDYMRTALVVRCGDRRKAVDAGQLFHISRDRKGQPVLDGFQGEQALISAMLEVADMRRPVVYYTVNHGELSPDALTPTSSDSKFIAELKARRFEVRALNLQTTNDVPANADLVLVAGPRVSFEPREADKLRRYLKERNGRMIALLEPKASHGLDDLLLDWGMLALDALVVDNDPAGKSPDGDVIIGRLPEGLHATTNILKELDLGLFAGRLRPVQVDPGRPSDTTLTEAELFFTSDKAWGERDYNRPPYSFDANKNDLPPPLCLGVAAERAVRMQGEARIPAGRLLVVGTADIATDARFEKGGNRYFLLNTANWLVDRTYLVDVPPRPLSEFKLNATAGDLASLARKFALVPAAVALLGFLVHFWRRRV